MMKTTIKLGVMGLTSILLLSQCGTRNPGETTETKVEADSKTPSLTMIWESPATLETVESVLFDETSGNIYTSNIGGKDPLEKDGNGSISILNSDGTIQEQNWVTGLHAPKGMGIANGNLYVTDVDALVEINLETAAITNSWTIEGAEFLNDVATHDGTVYFSDMRAGKVHAYQNGEITTVSEGNASINGLEVSSDGTLHGLDGSGLKKWNSDGSITLINDQVTGGDGLIILEDGNFVASRWKGEIWFASEGSQTKMLDTTESESNTADIGFNPTEKIVYVPTFFKNKVVAYKLDY